MRAYLTIILIGLVSAFIGIIPLFKRKADKYTVLSAFVLFLIMPYVVYHLSLPWTQWWWKGMIVSAVLTLPLVITSGRGSSRCAFPLLLASVVVGAFISFRCAKSAQFLMGHQFIAKSMPWLVFKK